MNKIFCVSQILLLLLCFQATASARALRHRESFETRSGSVRPSSSKTQLDKKIDSLRELIEKRPHSTESSTACLELGKLYLMRGDLSQGETYLNRAKASPFSDALQSEALYYLAAVQLASGDKSQAQSSLETIIKVYPSSSFFDLALIKLKGLYGDPSGGSVSGSTDWGESKGYYSVQVGSYSKRENAEKVAGKLKGKYTVTTSQVYKQNKVYYRVRVGEYRSREEASQVARLIKQSEGIPAIVVP